MRWHVRPLILCTIALFVAGCSSSDRPTEPPTTTDLIVMNVCELPPGTGCLADLIWDDLNCNGIQDPGEPGHAGVAVRLYECTSDVLVDETVSDATGHYQVCGPAPDEFYIVVELPEGCSFSPNNVDQPVGVKDIATDSDVDVNGVGFCTNLYDGECEEDMDVGICCPGTPCTSSIGDRVWFDVNCDGIQGESEVGGPQGVEVNLINCATGGTVGTTTTDANGYYLFSSVPAGEYKVCFELPDGYDWTLQDIGADGLDSDAGADGCTSCFILECDKPNLTKDAGLCEKKEEGEGCTPGFWKNHLALWAGTPYSPDMIVNDVFGCVLTPAGTTLGQAIAAPQTYGALVGHAIAGILNASHPDVDYAWTVGEVIDFACDRDKDSIADENEAGCPLSGGNTTGGGATSSLKIK